VARTARRRASCATHRRSRNGIDDKLEASHVRGKLQFASLPDRTHVRDVPHVQRQQLLREEASQGGEGGRLRQRGGAAAAAAAAAQERRAKRSSSSVEKAHVARLHDNAGRAWKRSVAPVRESRTRAEVLVVHVAQRHFELAENAAEERSEDRGLEVVEHGERWAKRFPDALHDRARLISSKMLGGASQIVSMIRVECNGT